MSSQSQPDADAQNQPIVACDAVRKVYAEGDEGVVALEDIDLSVEHGEFVSVVGPSGCGKTTLLHLIAGLLEPSTGSITVDGQSVLSESYQKHNVGLVFQQPVLLEWRTVLKNILLPVEIMHSNGVLTEPVDSYRDRATELIDLVGLASFEEKYPQELSGGMQQRVSICRSLIYDPAVLLMDEPFGALDALTRDKLNTELLRIWRETEKTVLFITHNLEEAVFLSDRVVVLSERPGQVKDIVDIEIPRPRDETTRTQSRFNELTGEVYEYFQ